MRIRLLLCLLGAVLLLPAASSQPVVEPLFRDPLNVNPPSIHTDRRVKYDYDIVYVRAPRKGDRGRTLWTEIAHPALMDPGADLMLLHPDGKEEVLVKGGADSSITDPVVSLDGESVFYAHIRGLKGTSQHGQPPFGGADIYRIHLRTRKITRLTDQVYTPNTGAADWSSDCRKSEPGKTYLNYGVLNLGPYPLPGGRLVFTSNRNGFIPPKHPSPCLQLFVMDEDGRNVEQIGYLNIGMALHPVVLKDGRIIFSSLESQGLRSSILWGLWSIQPDGTNWGPVLSALLPGEGAPDAFHFQTQLSDGSLVAERYYNQNNSGLGGYYKLPPPQRDPKYPGFGPAWTGDPRNPPLRAGRHYNGKGKYNRLAFSPTGIESLTRFSSFGEGPADPSILGKKDSPAVGKFTHPSGAPDNHLLTVWTPGPANHQYTHYPLPDGGIYLIKDGKPIDEPGQMLLIKNDPNYNEQWPRAVVPYQRIYGLKEPKKRKPLANDGKQSVHLPAGTPFGLVGTSSFYKRESYPRGAVSEGGVTAGWRGGNDPNGYRGLDPFNTSQNGASLNWVNQGADAGRYSNDDIHAVRILAMEPTTHRQRGPKPGRLFYSHAKERLRILGEIPLRKFPSLRAPLSQGARGARGQPLDPDGNPDTSFLAKIPADTAFTFQMLDKEGMVLNMAQTWHQVRPGEIRNDCGGCHAHSQKPTLFEKTAAAKPDYQVWDLTDRTPLLTSKEKDQSKKKWDVKDETGLRFAKDAVINVEFFRDVKPILERSCVACHTGKKDKPAGNLILDDDRLLDVPGVGKLPGTYVRLAQDRQAKYGYKPVIHNGTWRQFNASRYIRMFQSRRSLLVWKIYGRRTDGWTNDDFPTAKVPGDPNTLHWKGKPIANTHRNQDQADLDFTGSAMPPPEGVKAGKVAPLTDEDRRVLVRWIDLGCPIDRDHDPKEPARRGFGWMGDDNRPVLTLTEPQPGSNPPVNRILVGLYDYYSGLDEASFEVRADFLIDGVPAGQNLASKFIRTGPGIRELKLSRPLARLPEGKLTVSVKDRQGNVSKIERVFSIRQ
jgi:Hydrazine synthase alpha subunit middle domain